jgi:hypothetical protein
MFFTRATITTLGLFGRSPHLSQHADASDWWIVGFQQHFCRDTEAENTAYGWPGTDGQRHNFGEEHSNYLVTRYDDGRAIGCSGDESPKKRRLDALRILRGQQRRRLLFLLQAELRGRISKGFKLGPNGSLLGV